MKSIGQWQKEVHDLAVEKGWYDTTRTPLELHALIMSEVGEAVNEARNENPPVYFYDKNLNRNLGLNEVNRSVINFSSWKPEGEAVELADAVIRILDYAAFRGWDFEQVMLLKHNYNRNREYRHGNKKY